MIPKYRVVVFALLAAIPLMIASGQTPQAFLTPSESAAQLPTEAATQSALDPMIALVRAKIDRQPNHSDSWRMLGKLEAKNGNPLVAQQALLRSLELDPENAAAHFDIGEFWLASGDAAESSKYFDRCCQLAPESSYALQLYDRGLVTRQSLPQQKSTNNGVVYAVGDELPESADEIEPVGFEIQTFDGKDDFDQRFSQLRSDADPDLKRLRVFLETGVLYNTNVSLSPISRGLAPSGDESFQAVANPELEWIAIKRDRWRAGPLGRGYFTKNESGQSQFDLGGFQLGAFAERDYTIGSSEWISRLDYTFAQDNLDSDRLADRHSVTASLIMIGDDLDVTYLYLTTAFSDFVDNGVTPELDSLDGTSLTTGITRFFQTGKTWAPNYNVGIDGQWVDTDGSNSRYRSLTAHGEMTFQLRPRVSYIAGGGLGFRDFFDFTGDVNRDEFTWRVSNKLRWQITDRTAISLVGNYDRFASDNEDFDSERAEAGVIMSFNF